MSLEKLEARDAAQPVRRKSEQVIAHDQTILQGRMRLPKDSAVRKAQPMCTGLLDYFPDDFLFFVDESHVTVPQIRGMYAGDRSRKEVLVEYGFRLPSALDNRPLNFTEWEARVKQLVFVSATPGPWELKQSGGVIVEQIIRPTGLVDPTIDIRPVAGQVDDLLAEIRTVETILHGAAKTPYLNFGDRVRIEMKDANGASIFGAIDQKVVKYDPPG